jgi:hypothetical protein
VSARWLPPLLCLALCACPYGAPVPLDSPEKGVLDERLLGRWVQRHEKGLGFAEFEFLAFDDHQYVVTMRAHEPFKAEEDAVYRAFSSVVGGRAFLNCRDLKEKEGYVLAAFELSTPGVLRLTFIDDDAMKPAGEVKTSAQLRRFVAEHMAEKGFFEEGFVLERAEQPKK